MTYKQAAENGWQVRKGEKGTQIEFWEVKAEVEEKSGERRQGGRKRPDGQGAIAPAYPSRLHGLQRQTD